MTSMRIKEWSDHKKKVLHLMLLLLLLVAIVEFL